MRQQFNSLACLLKKVSRRGYAAKWDESNYTFQGEYTHKWGEREISVSKQFLGDFELMNGAQVIIRWEIPGRPPYVCCSPLTGSSDFSEDATVSVPTLCNKGPRPCSSGSTASR